MMSGMTRPNIYTHVKYLDFFSNKRNSRTPDARQPLWKPGTLGGGQLSCRRGWEEEEEGERQELKEVTTITHAYTDII